jgi:hypothetical protein
VERGEISVEAVTGAGGMLSKEAPAVVDPSAVAESADGRRSVRPEGSRVLLQRHWEPAREIPIPEGAGSHGGGDAMLLDDVFRGPSHDVLRRQAGYLDGVRSVLVGVAGNEAMRTGGVVELAGYGLPLARHADDPRTTPVTTDVATDVATDEPVVAAGRSGA